MIKFECRDCEENLEGWETENPEDNKCKHCGAKAEIVECDHANAYPAMYEYGHCFQEQPSERYAGFWYCPDCDTEIDED